MLFLVNFRKFETIFNIENVIKAIVRSITRVCQNISEIIFKNALETEKNV